ncbi:MAG: phosphate ABC transporter, permease protein PstA [Rhodobacteraceae bacterium]|nr:MAG: phosphate ABC transporter, permease protein PstA [Paracoccaceae bacterium]
MMSDFSHLAAHHTSKRASAMVKKRNAAQKRLKAYGIAAVLFSGLALATLMWTVIGDATGAIRENYVTLPVTLSADKIDPAKIGKADFSGITKAALREYFPTVKKRKVKRQLYDVVSSGAAFELRARVIEDPSLIGQTIDYRFLASDVSDLYLKGSYGTLVDQGIDQGIRIAQTGKSGIYSVQADQPIFATVTLEIQQELLKRAARLDGKIGQENNGVRVFKQRLDVATNADKKAEFLVQVEARMAKRDAYIVEAEHLRALAKSETYSGKIDKFMPSILARVGDGWIKFIEINPNGGLAKEMLPIGDVTQVGAGQWELFVNSTPEVARKTSDNQIIWLETLRAQGRVDDNFNWRFFTSSDSREPELAGIWGALIGSILTMSVTFVLAFPIGVFSAIYLEEFAPKNRLTDFVEVNINNLAAVPSIVFGLLGLSVFLGVFGVPRSAPLAGGIVLALMSLPTIIIASRAAIRAVPPSIRDAALGLGASKLQTSFHHVLPLAMPGVLTGAIIAMAQALGETAPLIMIGMVAFIVDIPHGITDSASVLPVQVFRWADFPERAFEARTAAAICVLLVFLILMNAFAVFLRKKFERRW